MPTLTTFINIVLEVLVRAIRQRNKKYSNWKKRSKTITILEDMISYTENPKIPPKIVRTNKQIQ